MLFRIFLCFHLIHLGDLFISVNKGSNVLEPTGMDLFSSPISITPCQQKLEIGHGGIYPMDKCYNLATPQSPLPVGELVVIPLPAHRWIKSTLLFFNGCIVIYYIDEL